MARKGNIPSLSKDARRGDRAERNLFTDVIEHYDMARSDLDARIPDFDTKDELFRSHIDEANWPYSSVVFDPRVFTAIFEKTSRLFANKLRGRMVPREGGDSLGAQINNELLSFQWDDNERVDQQSMLSKWAMMDQNCRKYGSSFALCKWRHERKFEKNGKKMNSVPFYDGPDFKPLVNRDVLVNPSYSTIKKWFQYREYLTVDELKGVNDAARGKPIYKNLDVLMDSLKKSSEFDKGNRSDNRDNNWVSKNKSIKGLQDWLGQDKVYRTVEVVTEYRPERWITFAPKHGVILRDIPNPYDHQQIPVVQLKYYQVDDDIYGLSEIEPVEKLQKATNALINQYLDSINMSLYVPLKIRASGVQMHTIQFGPGQKWIMNDPASDVIPHEYSGKGVGEFTSTYRFMVGAMQEALGETSQGVSNIVPGGNEKTATEVRDTALQRNARDNFNQMFLGEAIKKQMMFWHLLDRQFLFTKDKDGEPNDGQAKVIRIVGKDAIRYFESVGLGDADLDGEAEGFLQTDEGIDLVERGMDPDELAVPQFPVNPDGQGDIPKFVMDGEDGQLIITPEDLSGTYDFIPDVESMSLPNEEQLNAQLGQLVEIAKDPATVQLLQQEGKRIKYAELLEDFFEKRGLKDASKYFERSQNVDETGAATAEGGGAGQGNVPNARVAGSAGTPTQGQAGPVVPRPV